MILHSSFFIFLCNFAKNQQNVYEYDGLLHTKQHETAARGNTIV